MYPGSSPPDLQESLTLRTETLGQGFGKGILGHSEVILGQPHQLRQELP